ncbi:cation efflux protein [Zopfochytrium polystomum]|nr:cation efflux protein [Zopfochytrium polystomum]
MGLGKVQKMTILAVLVTIFFWIELIVGFLTGSMALVADSFHMLSDLVALVVAFIAIRLAAKKGDIKGFTFGYQRAEVLGAFTNGIILLSLSFTVILDAIQRFFDPMVVANPMIVLIVGCMGFAMNLFGMFLFMGGDDGGHGHSHGGGGHGHSHGGGGHGGAKHESDVEEGGKKKKKRSSDMNFRGIFLHAMSDAIGNFGVIASSLVIMLATGDWRFYMDGVASVIISLVVINSAMPLVKESTSILLQGTPMGVDVKQIKRDILALEDVQRVENLHVWRLSESKTVGAVHVHVHLPLSEQQNMDQESMAKIDTKRFTSWIEKILHMHGISQSTVQISVHREESIVIPKLYDQLIMMKPAILK